MLTRSGFGLGFRSICLLGLMLVIASAAILSYVSVVSDGLKHVETASMFRLAGEDLRKGNFREAAHKFFIALSMTVEGGIRSQMAQVYLRQTRLLSQQNQLPAALNTCIAAAYILGSYDDEGATGYTCDVIQYQIQH